MSSVRKPRHGGLHVSTQISISLRFGGSCLARDKARPVGQTYQLESGRRLEGKVSGMRRDGTRSIDQSWSGISRRRSGRPSSPRSEWPIEHGLKVFSRTLLPVKALLGVGLSRFLNKQYRKKGEERRSRRFCLFPCCLEEKPRKEAAEISETRPTAPVVECGWGTATAGNWQGLAVVGAGWISLRPNRSSSRKSKTRSLSIASFRLLSNVDHAAGHGVA